MLKGVGLVASGLLALSALMSGPVYADSHIVTVASGLDNPRGIAIDATGAVYVAEAGTGGTGSCILSPEGDEVCFGLTGAVTRIDHGTQERIISGLPSLAGEDGSSATGPVDVSLQGKGNLYVVVGLGADPAVRSTIDGGDGLGVLLRATPHGTYRVEADVAAYEARANPDGGLIDSNPYSVLNDGGKRVIADAGGNSLVEVGANGRISTLATFPDRLVDAPPFPGLPPQLPMQSVPTSVVQGPDGAYYVGELTGFPFPVGGARVYRVVRGQTPTVYAEGFTNIIDLAFDRRGNLYVLELAANSLLSGDLTGALIRVAPNGTQTVVASDGLVAPGGLAIAKDGSIYVSNYSIFPGAGEVLKIRP